MPQKQIAIVRGPEGHLSPAYHDYTFSVSRLFVDPPLVLSRWTHAGPERVYAEAMAAAIIISRLRKRRRDVDAELREKSGFSLSYIFVYNKRIYISRKSETSAYLLAPFCLASRILTFLSSSASSPSAK